MGKIKFVVKYLPKFFATAACPDLAEWENGAGLVHLQKTIKSQSALCALLLHVSLPYWLWDCNVVQEQNGGYIMSS